MIISTVGIELNENVYVNKEGKFLFRIEKFEEDGFTNAGDARFKLHFKGVEVGAKEPVYLHNEQFNIGQSSLFRIKQVEVALKAPEVYDINNFVGRYIIANIKQENFTKKDGTPGIRYKVKRWEYSTLNDKMLPIPEAKQDEDNGINESVKVEEVTDEECPF